MRTVFIEPTENPKVMKFVADYNLIPGSLELDRNSDISGNSSGTGTFQLSFCGKSFHYR